MYKVKFYNFTICEKGIRDLGHICPKVELSNFEHLLNSKMEKAGDTTWNGISRLFFLVRFVRLVRPIQSVITLACRKPLA